MFAEDPLASLYCLEAEAGSSKLSDGYRPALVLLGSIPNLKAFNRLDQAGIHLDLDFSHATYVRIPSLNTEWFNIVATQERPMLGLRLYRARVEPGFALPADEKQLQFVIRPYEPAIEVLNAQKQRLAVPAWLIVC